MKDRLNYLESIGIQFAAGQKERILNRVEGGEDIEAVWSDVLRYVVGSEGNRAVVEQWVAEQFGEEEISAQRMDRLVNELVSGKRGFREMRADIYEATKRSPNQTGEQTDLGDDDIRLLGGQSKWYVTEDGQYFIAYKIPGTNHWSYFEASEQELEQIFGEGILPDAEEIKSERTLANNRRFHYGGTVAEVSGDGNFQAEAEGAMARALRSGRLPDWAQENDEIIALVFLSEEEEWSDDKLMEEISKTRAFKKRFKGIEELYSEGLSVAEAVSAYRDYENQLNALYKRHDLDKVVKPGDVGRLIEKGHSIDDVTFIYEKFKQMQDNQHTFRAFNNILQQRNMKPLKKQDQMKFLMGEAPAELYDIWEETAILDAARQAGIGNYLSAAEAVRLAERTAGVRTDTNINRAMQEAAALALRFRASIDVGRYGLNADDIIDMSMGLAPRSGVSGAELQSKMQKIAKEAEKFLRQQATPYIGFTESGVPGARSFGESRQEGI